MRDKEEGYSIKHAKTAFGLSIAGLVLTIIITILWLTIFGIYIKYIMLPFNNVNNSDELDRFRAESDDYLANLLGVAGFMFFVGIPWLIVTIITIVYVIMMSKKTKLNLALVSWIMLLLSIIFSVIIIFAIIGYALAIKASSDIIKKGKDKEPYFYYDENPTAINRHQMKEEGFSTRWTD